MRIFKYVVIQKYSYILIFFFALLLILLTSPFEIPLWQDRAYLLYMSQVIYRGENIYEVTTFGYTPLAQLIAGSIMRIVELFTVTVDTILISRILGILLYAACCSAFLALARNIFKNIQVSFIISIFFTGISFLQYISATNLEPKILAMFFEIMAIIGIMKSRYLFAGVFFALAAMCWQPMVINCFAVTGFILLNQQIISCKAIQFIKLLSGVLIGTLPIVFYIILTGQLQDFWFQAVMRKIGQEGSELFDDPLRWLFISIYPTYINEAFIFVLSSMGFLIISYKSTINMLKGKWASIKDPVKLFFILTVFWSLFNTLEFQGPLDLLPMIPILLIWAGYFISYLTARFPSINSKWMLIPAILYALLNTFSYQYSGTYSEQKEFINQIAPDDQKILPFSFEEYAVIKEIPLPSRLMRFEKYEDFIIDRIYERGCLDVIDQLRENKDLVAILARYNPENGQSKFGECGEAIIKEFTDSSGNKNYEILTGRSHILLNKFKRRAYRYYVIKNREMFLNNPDKFQY